MRSTSPILSGGLVGALTGLPVAALSYLAEQWAGLPFVPFLLFDWLARTLPGDIVTAGIDAMVAVIHGLGLGPIDVVAKAAEQFIGILMWVVVAALAGAAIAWGIAHRDWPGRQVGAAVGALIALAVIVIEVSLRGFSGNFPLTLLWIVLLISGWGALLGIMLQDRLLPAPAQAAPEGYDEYRAGRRAFLARIGGGSIVVALAAWGLGRLLAERTEATGAGQDLEALGLGEAPTPAPAPAQTPLSAGTPGVAMRESVPAAPGTRPEITPNADFYRIDINLAPPTIRGEDWEVQVAGLFDRPRNLKLSDFMAFTAVTQPATLSCISNPIGGDLIGTTNWTGVRLRDVLDALGVRPEVQGLLIRAADGFYESVEPMDFMDPRTLLVYGMNGETLPVEHGFPLRIYIPNRYGMKQPKWITYIEAMDHLGPGYWIDRGWDAKAIPRVISIIDTVAREHTQGGRVPVGGIAWAGERGISKVEVQVDEGQWDDAVLRTPPIGPLTWVTWRYDWPVTPGSHTFRARATDGTGALQIGEEHQPHPAGATGYHAVTATF